jgi:hypothetical protein
MLGPGLLLAHRFGLGMRSPRLRQLHTGANSLPFGSTHRHRRLGRTLGRRVFATSAPSDAHRLHQWRDSRDMHQAFEVVSEHVQIHLRADMLQRAHQEVCRSQVVQRNVLFARTAVAAATDRYLKSESGIPFPRQANVHHVLQASVWLELLPFHKRPAVQTLPHQIAGLYLTRNQAYV